MSLLEQAQPGLAPNRSDSESQSDHSRSTDEAHRSASYDRIRGKYCLDRTDHTVSTVATELSSFESSTPSDGTPTPFGAFIHYYADTSFSASQSDTIGVDGRGVTDQEIVRIREQVTRRINARFADVLRTDHGLNLDPRQGFTPAADLNKREIELYTNPLSTNFSFERYGTIFGALREQEDRLLDSINHLERLSSYISLSRSGNRKLSVSSRLKSFLSKWPYAKECDLVAEIIVRHEELTLLNERYTKKMPEAEGGKIRQMAMKTKSIMHKWKGLMFRCRAEKRAD